MHMRLAAQKKHLAWKMLAISASNGFPLW